MSGHDAYFHSNFLEHFNNVFVAGKHHHLMTLAGKLLQGFHGIHRTLAIKVHEYVIENQRQRDSPPCVGRRQ